MTLSMTDRSSTKLPPNRSEAAVFLQDMEYVSHSVDVVRSRLIPKLAERLGSLHWIVSDSRKEACMAMVRGNSNVSVKRQGWKRGTAMQIVDGLLRRLGNQNGDFGDKMRNYRQKLRDQQTATDAKKSRAEWTLSPCIMNQPLAGWTKKVAGIIYDVSPTLSSATLQNMDRWCQHADLVFCVSEFTRSEVAKRVPEAKARLVTLPIGPCSHELNRQCTRRNPARGALKVFCPAFLHFRKGQHLLLEAALLCKNWGAEIEIILCGAGTDKLLSGTGNYPQAERACAALVEAGGAVRLLGHVSTLCMEDLWTEADVLAFPSNYEGFGLPVSEAAMRGLPVISSDLPSIREQIDLYQLDERILLFESQNPRALAQLLMIAARREGPAPLKPEELRQNFARWTWDHIADRLLGCISQSRVNNVAAYLHS